METKTTNTTTALEIFNYEGKNKIRTVRDDNGEVWFVAKDVAQALEYSRFDSNLLLNVPECWKGTKPIRTPGGNQGMLCISEQGLYFFLGRSDKPKALPFQMWLAGEVVPQIRKTGAYVSDNALRNPEFLKQLAARLDAIEAENKNLRDRILQDQPCTTVGKIVLSSPHAYTPQEAAQVLAQHGIPIGQNRLFKRFRDKKLLGSRKGRQYNKPTQKAVEQGLLGLRANEKGLAVVVMPKCLAKLADELTEEYMPIIYLVDRTEALNALEG